LVEIHLPVLGDMVICSVDV